MRKRFQLFLAVAVAVALVPGTASAEEPDQYYVSVGTSLAAGTQANATGASIPFTDESYTDVLAQRLTGRLRVAEHVKLGCPGETTESMLFGPPAIPLCDYGPEPTQLAAAVAFLEAHPGEVTLITIDVGVNDVLPCAGEEDIALCVAGASATVATNLPVILTALRTAAGPDVPIVGMNYYNPLLASWLAGPEGQAVAIATNELAAFFNDDVLAPVYAAFEVPVADVAAQFQTFDFSGADKGKTPRNVKVICRLTFMCDVGNIHPDKGGYKQIAKAFQDVMKDAGII